MKSVVLHKYMNCTVNKAIGTGTGHTIYTYQLYY